MLFFLLSCVHTPPHPATPNVYQVRFERKEEMTHSGEYCSWEAESLYQDQIAVWARTAPLEEGWCEAPGEYSRWIDVLGQDGNFLSVKLTEQSCCPDRKVVLCHTFDLYTGQKATLQQYDEKHAEKRIAKAEKMWKKKWPDLPYAVDPDNFIVGGGHVQFCVVEGDEIRLLPVR